MTAVATAPAHSRGVRRRHSVFTVADGTRLTVVESGSGPATVVLVHGWTQDHTCWDPVVRRLEGVRVLRYDHRGHGTSDPAKPGTATIEQIADDLAELLADRVPDGPLVLAGHSMGGMTIMALAQRHPELVERRVSGVAFVGTSSGQMDRLTLGLPGVAGRAAPRVERMIHVLLERRRKDTLPGSPAFLAPFTRWLVFGRRAARADVLAVAAQALRGHPNSLAGFRTSIAQHDRKVVLGSLRGKPTVVLAGDRDRLCPLAHAKVIAGELPDAVFVRYPGAGHMLSYERPGEVAARIAGVVQLCG
ncbi:alpha/beta fold hydrolase [Amycolatopsis suaedae]|uniref:Alpha/beta hydrolase n=1 Tax=Amycolatopsis suaedae TaxID=2510978 RepID=A0A4V2ELT0_9PSEU|nr:alpha/beta hydrolase [Amycolatopsis suaedae]RZQ62635.1 alpha/beta hydrolase [Amycolatopsis suaedae]